MATADGPRVRGRAADRRGPHQRRDRRRARDRAEDRQQPRRAHPGQARGVPAGRDRVVGQPRGAERPASTDPPPRPASGADDPRPTRNLGTPDGDGTISSHHPTHLTGAAPYDRGPVTPTPEGTDGHRHPSRRPPASRGEALHLRVGRRPRRGQRRHARPARRQGRRPRRDDDRRPADPARLHDHHRGLQRLLRGRRAAAGRALGRRPGCGPRGRAQHRQGVRRRRQPAPRERPLRARSSRCPG